MNPLWMVIGGAAVLLYFARQAGVVPGGSESAATDSSAAGSSASAAAAARPRPTGATNALLPTGAAMTLREIGGGVFVSPSAANPGTAPSAFNPNVAGPISAPSVNVQIPSYVDASYVPTINTTLGEPTQPGDAGVTGIPIAIAPDIPIAVADAYVPAQGFTDAPVQQEQQNYEPLAI